MKNPDLIKIRRRLSARRQPVKPYLIATFLGALACMPGTSSGGTPPATHLLYTSSAGIHGGVATIGTSGITYFSTMRKDSSTGATVTKLGATGTVLWTFPAPDTVNHIFSVPALDTSGANLYIG